jgi:hypothetical protein
MKRRDFTPEEQARIQRRIRERGMTFEVFLPEDMADWLREKLAAGVFDSASISRLCPIRIPNCAGLPVSFAGSA